MEVITEELAWNNSTLTLPPVEGYKNEHRNFDCKQMQAIINDMTEIVSNQDKFHKECAVLNRLVYKLDRKFRHDIGYSYFKRTSVAVLKYNTLNFAKSLAIFTSVSSNYEHTLPSRQMFEFILIRLQSYAKILTRIVYCSRKAATYYFDRIKRSDAVWLSFMPYAVLSNVWFTARHLLKNSCKWYDSLVPFRNKLKIIGEEFVTYEFPMDLGSWLDVDWMDERAGQLWKTGTIMSYLEIDSEPTDVKIETEIPNTTIYQSYVKPEAVLSDVGQRVVRKIDGIVKTKTILHKLTNVIDKRSLLSFLESEEKFRNKQSESSLTNHLGIMQWNTLKTVLLKIKNCDSKLYFKKIKNTWESRV